MRANCQLERQREPTRGHRGYGEEENREYCSHPLTEGVNIERFRDRQRATFVSVF